MAEVDGAFFLDAITANRDASILMRRLAFALTPVLAVFTFGCQEDPEEPNAFQTTTSNTTAEEETDTGSLPDLANGDGDGDDPTTGDGDGDDPTTGDGDGDGDPSTGDGDGDPVCGNGVIDDGEQCDGGNLGGFSCSDLGYAGGTLACDPVTCTYDASGCTTNNDGSSGGTTG